MQGKTFYSLNFHKKKISVIFLDTGNSDFYESACTETGYGGGLYFNPHTNMWDPRGPRKTLIASQTLIIGISEAVHSFYVIRVSFRGLCGPRIFKNMSFFYIRMRVKPIFTFTVCA